MHFVCSRPPPLPPKKIFAEPLSWISLGTTVIPKRNWKQWLCKIFLGGWGGGAVNKLYYGLCEGHEWAEFTSLPPGERIPYNGLQGRLGLRGIPFLGLRYIDSRAVKG